VTFYTTGMEHSPTSATGTGWERTTWRATQRAEWKALRRPATHRDGLVWGMKKVKRGIGDPATHAPRNLPF